MNVNTLLLAHLAKSQEGNAQQLDGDTKIVVPNVFTNCLSVPDIFNFINSAPQTGIEKHSFVQVDTRLVNAAAIVTLCTVGPGLWELDYDHFIIPEGATNDITAIARLQLVLLDGPNPTIDLTRLSNTAAIRQQCSGHFKALISSEQALAFQISYSTGAGTGTNRAHVRIFGNRLL